MPDTAALIRTALSTAGPGGVSQALELALATGADAGRRAAGRGDPEGGFNSRARAPAGATRHSPRIVSHRGLVHPKVTVMGSVGQRGRRWAGFCATPRTPPWHVAHTSFFRRKPKADKGIVLCHAVAQNSGPAAHDGHADPETLPADPRPCYPVTLGIEPGRHRWPVAVASH